MCHNTTLEGSEQATWTTNGAGRVLKKARFIEYTDADMKVSGAPRGEGRRSGTAKTRSPRPAAGPLAFATCWLRVGSVFAGICAL